MAVLIFCSWQHLLGRSDYVQTKQHHADDHHQATGGSKPVCPL